MKLLRCVEYKDKYTKERHTAILNSCNSHVFMFFVIRESAIDGVEFVDRACVKQLASKSNYAKFIDGCIDEGLIRIPQMRQLGEDDAIKDLLRVQKNIIGIDTIRKNELIFMVGRVGAFEEKGFEIECCDQRGRVGAFNYYFRFSEVARLVVGGSYLAMLNKWRQVANT